MLEAITILIPKAGDPLEPSNYRPISLLNTDYKLLTKHLNSLCFPSILESCIPTNQLCAVPGRDIRDGTLMIRDVIQYVQDKHGKAILMSLDQKKAFDAVDRDFLFKTLEKFGVPTRLSAILKTLYTDTFTKIQVNGHLSESVALERGVRQGCPLSPTLYVLYVQMFVNFIAKTHASLE
ncbi:hypothetical protein EB796_023230 [Bugula neritina]|uniref:Reverse transcriptase domain-containing protein n=2 Tax=Bugula neritina TaxID=10212 RepID=A0A7J7IY29_BUGNE|nr:hypothetical protein EB796_023230 [Bugula neritina]